MKPYPSGYEEALLEAQAIMRGEGATEEPECTDATDDIERDDLTSERFTIFPEGIVLDNGIKLTVEQLRQQLDEVGVIKLAKFWSRSWFAQYTFSRHVDLEGARTYTLVVATDRVNRILRHDDFPQLYQMFLFQLVNLNHTKFTSHTSF